MAKPLISGASFWKFEENPIFIGRYLNEVKREKDGEGENQKAGTVMGFAFVDNDGEQHLIGNSHAIGKAVAQINEGDILKIHYKGQTKNAKGQKVNVFSIDLLESEAEWREELGIEHE